MRLRPVRRFQINQEKPERIAITRTAAGTSRILVGFGDDATDWCWVGRLAGG
jgi:hypothetical protein